MKITWLGQAGFIFETLDLKILIDPYLSNSVAESQPQNYRRFPVDQSFLKIKPNVLVITHDHADHFDKETLKHFLTDNSKMTVLSPWSVWQEIRKFGGENNYVLFNSGTTWTENNIKFKAVKAEHSDFYAIGVIINVEGKNYYVTGDTLYNEAVLESVKDIEIEALFLPINGKGNNMNKVDAATFAKRVGAKYIVPMHFGLFDNLSATEFLVDNKLILTPYKEIVLDK